MRRVAARWAMAGLLALAVSACDLSGPSPEAAGRQPPPSPSQPVPGVSESEDATPSPHETDVESPPAIPEPAEPSSPPEPAPPPASPSDTESTVPDDNVLAREALAVPPNAAAVLAAQMASSDPEAAALLRRIGDQPQAQWLVGGGDAIAADVAARMEDAGGDIPVFVLYNLPDRHCGNALAGGAESPEAYRAWIDGVAEGIGDRAAGIVVEPDALALADCLPPDDREQRAELVAYAVDTLAANPDAAVYVDAGHAAWHPPAEMARRLEGAGIGGARGFALNVSNFRTTQETIAYARGVDAALGGGMHVVVDTSRNGNGPLAAGEADGGPDWCNPPGRALGHVPTADTGDEFVDAYLWIKAPGESDGLCRGGPPDGVFWPEYAVGLAERATP